jgi:hypothetical protein
LAFGPAKFYPHILTINISSFAQALTQSCKEWSKCPGRRTVQKPDHRRGLLRARRERPRRRAADQGNEIAPIQVTELHPQPTSQGDSIPDWRASNSVAAVRHFDPA